MLRFLLIGLFLFFTSFTKAPPPAPQSVLEEPVQQKICLNMIVKNEAKIITRCLDSIKPFISYWVIVDTGSTDGTQEIIQEHMKDIPGELHERPWKNWGETRSVAFDLAKGKGDYILFMDADDILEFDEGFELPELTADLYFMWRGTKNYSYLKPQIVKGDISWRWVGVTHEYLTSDTHHSTSILEGVHYTSIDDGATRSTGIEKYLKNVVLLEEGLKEEPDNSRYAFYLAESYRDSNQPAKALEWYQKRVDMGGWDQETYCAKLQIGHMLHRLGLPKTIVLEAYKNAFGFRPHRVESIYYIAKLYNEMGNHAKAYELLKARNFLPRPAEKDGLFNEDWIERYGILFELSICAYYLGHYEESLDACDALLADESLPEDLRGLTETNRTYPAEKLKEKL